MVKKHIESEHSHVRLRIDFLAIDFLTEVIYFEQSYLALRNTLFSLELLKISIDSDQSQVPLKIDMF